MATIPCDLEFGCLILNLKKTATLASQMYCHFYKFVATGIDPYKYSKK